MRIAKNCGITQTLIPKNGDLVKIQKGEKPRVIDMVDVGILALDGNRLLSFSEETFKMRRKLNYNGAMFVTLILDKRNRCIKGPFISNFGVFDEKDPAIDKALIENALLSVLDEFKNKKQVQDDFLAEELRIAVRRSINRSIQKKPLVSIHLLRG